MGSKRNFLLQLVSRRISQRVAFWIFVSILVIEGIVLIPSVRREQRELLRQLRDQTSIKVTWLVANSMVETDNESSGEELDVLAVLEHLQDIREQDPSFLLLGASIYSAQGKLLASIGDRPSLDWQKIQAGQTTAMNSRQKDYEMVWSAAAMPEHYIVVRQSIEPIHAELRQYKLRIGLLVIIISIFVTGSTLLVMQILVIAPVLKLRDDLQTAGELVVCAPEQIQCSDLHSLNHHRHDELGDVMDEFRSMLTRITTEIQQRIHAENNVRQEQKKSEELLLNILPASVAKELKENRRYVAEGFNDVSILFADLVGFTSLSAHKKPAEVVTLLNDIFSSFDRLSEIYNLEKIKTIGDAYMVAGGLPLPRSDHGPCMADMALEMLSEIERLNSTRGYSLQVRIGIHCGSVVAGVIGTRKFIYDLWGDAVNVASRMESHGVPSCIQVTKDFRDKLGDDYLFKQRGEIEVKGKGLMQTYFLKGKRMSLSRLCL